MFSKTLKGNQGAGDDSSDKSFCIALPEVLYKVHFTFYEKSSWAMNKVKPGGDAHVHVCANVRYSYCAASFSYLFSPLPHPTPPNPICFTLGKPVRKNRATQATAEEESQ